MIYCLIASYPRSGHSLIGSIIDAHPHMMLGDEVGTQRLAMDGVGQEEIINKLIVRSRHGPRVQIDSKWVGNCRGLHVVGDKPRPPLAWSTEHERPWKVDFDLGGARALFGAIELPIKIIHVLRNPYDIIASIKIHGWAIDLDTATALFFSTLDTNQLIRERKYPWLDIRLESLIASPIIEISNLCSFLGEVADSEYVRACENAVWERPHLTRTEVEWPTGLISHIARQINDRRQPLGGYSYD